MGKKTKKQINLDVFKTRSEKLGQVKKSIKSREMNAFASGGLEDPYITDDQFEEKFICSEGLDFVLDLAEEFYDARYKRYVKNKMIKRFEKAIDRLKDPICMRIVELNDEFLDYESEE